MARIEARYEHGTLHPSQPLPLRSGELVNLILVRKAGPARWDPDRLAAAAGDEDRLLAEQGLAEWTEALDREDRR